MTKSDTSGRGAAKNETKFLFFWISYGSDSITLSSDKKRLLVSLR